MKYTKYTLAIPRLLCSSLLFSSHSVFLHFHLLHLECASFIWQAIFWLNYCARIDSNQMERKRHLHISHFVMFSHSFARHPPLTFLRFYATLSGSILYYSFFYIYFSRIVNITIVSYHYVHLKCVRVSVSLCVNHLEIFLVYLLLGNIVMVVLESRWLYNIMNIQLCGLDGSWCGDISIDYIISHFLTKDKKI